MVTSDRDRAESAWAPRRNFPTGFLPQSARRISHDYWQNFLPRKTGSSFSNALHISATNSDFVACDGVRTHNVV
jgi:hypothetical protein